MSTSPKMRAAMPAALVLLMVSAACAQSRGSTPASAPLPTVAGKQGTATVPAAPFDQQFIDMMVPHHQAAVEMARIALERGQHPEIKTLATDILQSQGEEIDQMKAWRKAWYGSEETPPMSHMPLVPGVPVSAPPSDNMGGMAGMNHGPVATSDGTQTMDMASEVADLRSAPETFDKAFLTTMIPHHRDAIAAAKAAQTRAQRPEIQQLAKSILTAQDREIAQMGQWRQAWFPGS